MSMLTLNNDCLASVTAVPDLFLEQYMPAANGEFVKVYLYLLKLVKDHQQDSTLSSMADFFSCTENDIVRALKYWEKQGILSLSYTAGESVPTGIAFLPLVRKEESGILPTPESSISGPIAAAPAVSAVSVEIPQTEQTPAPSPQPAVSAPSASSPADDLSSSGISGQSAEKNTLPAAAKNCSTFFTLRRRISVIFCRQRKSNASCFSMMISIFPRIFWNTWWNTVFRREAPASTT